MIVSAAAAKIVVIGAGIVGASIADHLAQRGAAVTIVDSGRPGLGVSGRSFAWINASHGKPFDARLRLGAIDDWRRLESELRGALRVNWCGGLCWKSDPTETASVVRDCNARGFEIRLIDKEEILKLEPGLVEAPQCPAHAIDEGAVDSIAAIDALIRAARECGAAIRLDAAVRALVATNGRIVGVRTSGDALDAGIVVVAAGVETACLFEPLRIELPVTRSPALLFKFKTPGPVVSTIVSSPDLEVRQASKRLILAAENYIGETPRNEPRAIARRTLALIRRQLRGGPSAELEAVEIGARPIPADGLPIAGFTSDVQGAYVAVMHAGVTLAPAIGRLAATEILDGRQAEALERCRPQRLAAPHPLRKA